MKIAILGFGVVGRGAYEVAKDAIDIDVKRILVRMTKPEYEDVADKLTMDITDIIEDDEIELVVESIGGVDIPREHVLACLKAGKHVVTPNKNLISACYDELMACAAENNVALRFTATAGGGIPWLFNLRRTKRCDKITEVHGILNGTSNYILDSMHKDKASFEDVLKKAQELGYAESDPSADIEGTDVLRKAVISTNIAFDTVVKEESVPCYGIDTIEARDIEYFEAHGYTCKLMMFSKRQANKVSVYVEPTLFPQRSLEANVSANNNLVTLIGESIGTQSFFGQGAGSLATGESVIQDVIDVRDGVELEAPVRFSNVEVDNDGELHTYYIRHDNMCEHIEPLIDSYEEKDGIFYCVSKPITIEQMHEIGHRRKSKGKKMFFACIAE